MVHDMVHDLRKNPVEVLGFFVTHACTESLHKAHKISCTKISNSSSPEIDKRNYSSYILFKFKWNCLMSTFCLFTFLSANIVMFFAIMTPFSAVMFMIECSVTQSDILIKSDMSITWKMSKYGVFSDPYSPAFELNAERYVKRGWREKWEIV